MEKNMQEQEMIDGMMRTDRIASAVGQLPGDMRDDLAHIVAGEQKTGSFGDLVKRAFDLVEEGKRQEGGNVVSMVGKRPVSSS